MLSNKRIKLDTTEQINAIILSEIDIELGLRKRLAQTLESRIAWASLLLESLQNETECASEVSFKDVALDALSVLESPSDVLFVRDMQVPTQHVPPRGRLPPKEKPITRSQKEREKAKFVYLRSKDSPQIFLLRCPVADCHRSTFSNLQGLYNHGRLSHHLDWGTHEECVKACAVPQEELDTELDLDAGVDAGGGNLLPGVRSLFQMAVEGTRDAKPAKLSSEFAQDRSIHLTQTLGLHSDSPALAQFLGKEAKRKGITVWDDGMPIDITSFAHDSHAKPAWKKMYVSRSKPNVEEEASLAIEIDQRTAAASTSPGLPNPAAAISSRFHISCRVTLTDSSLYIPEAQRLQEKKEHTHQWMISVESPSYSLDLTTVLTSLTVRAIDSDLSVSFPPLITTEPPFVVVGTTAEPFLAQVELMFNPSISGPGQNGQKVFLEHWVGLDMIGTNRLATKGDEQVVDLDLDKDTVVRLAKTGYTPVNSRSHWENILNVASGKRAKTQLNDYALIKVENTIPSSYAELLESLLPQFPMTFKDIPSKDAKAMSKLPYALLPGHTQLTALTLGRRKAIEWARARALQTAYTDRILVLRERDPCSHLIPLTTGDVFSWMEDHGHFIRATERKAFPMVEEQQDDTLSIIDYSEGRWCRVCGLGLWAHGTEGLEYVKNVSDMAAAAAAAKAQMVEKQKEKPALSRIKIKLIDGKIVSIGGRTSTPHPTPPPFQCQIVVKMLNLQLLKMPVVDIHRILGPRIQKEAEQAPSSLLNPRQLPPWSSRTHRLVRDDRILVSAVDPHLTLGVRSLVNTLHLPPFTSSPSPFPLHSIGSDAIDVEENLSPHALLALATKQFIRVLIKEAVEVEKRDKELGVGFLFKTHNRDVSLLTSGPSGRKYKTTGSNATKKGREKEKMRIQSIKVLTPMHIITGVVSNYVRATALASMPSENNRPGTAGGDDGGSIGVAVYGCLSRLGTSIEENYKKDS